MSLGDNSQLTRYPRCEQYLSQRASFLSRGSSPLFLNVDIKKQADHSACEFIMVEHRGLEPLTFGLQSRRSTS